jgi:hypothetical protein
MVQGARDWCGLVECKTNVPLLITSEQRLWSSALGCKIFPVGLEKSHKCLLSITVTLA